MTWFSGGPEAVSYALWVKTPRYLTVDVSRDWDGTVEVKVKSVSVCHGIQGLV
jgi:hypothetical protein